MLNTDPKKALPWKEWKRWQRRTMRVILGVLAFLVFIIIVSPETETTADPKSTREEYFKKNGLFSAWDGRPPALVELIKQSMNDPNSFEHLETRFIDKGTDTITVSMDYTGKNAFGGRVRGKAIAIMNAKDGSVIEVISNQ